MTLPRIVIIGGGLAGLSATEAILRNHPAKFQVTLIEAKRQLGGRTSSFTDQSTGESIDYCQHVAMGCCTNFCHLIERCGLMPWFRRDSELVFLHPDYPPSEFSPSKILPPPLHLARTLSAIKYLTAKQKNQVRRGLWRLMRTSSKELVNVTAAEWLRGHGQDPSTLKDYWDVILVSALGEESNFVTMAAARKVFMDGFALARGAADVLIPTQPLSKLFGESLYEHLKAMGATIRMGEQVKNIGYESHPTVHLGSGETMRADHIIVAVPWYRIRDLFRTPTVAREIPDLDLFANFPTSPISGLHLWFDRPITDRRHAVMVGTLSQWMFRDPIDSCADKGQYYYQVVISASRTAREMNKSELLDRVTGELRHAFPGARAANLLRHRMVTDPKSVFSIRPDIDAQRPDSKTGLPWLHLAGDWIKTGWPATMEGAVISGRLAVNSMLDQQNLPGVDIDSGLRPGRLAKLLIKP